MIKVEITDPILAAKPEVKKLVADVEKIMNWKAKEMLRDLMFYGTTTLGGHDENKGYRSHKMPPAHLPVVHP